MAAGDEFNPADKFRRGIEAAYTKMREIAERGEAPRNFAVANNASVRNLTDSAAMRVFPRMKVHINCASAAPKKTSPLTDNNDNMKIK